MSERRALYRLLALDYGYSLTEDDAAKLEELGTTSRDWTMTCWISRELHKAGLTTGGVDVPMRRVLHADEIRRRVETAMSEWLAEGRANLGLDDEDDV